MGLALSFKGKVGVQMFPKTIFIMYVCMYVGRCVGYVIFFPDVMIIKLQVINLIESSPKPLINSCFGGEFCPIFDMDLHLSKR